MNFNVVECAAWVILGKLTGELLLGLAKGKRQELEKDAVTLEYYDDGTSPERMQQLVMRYPQHLISEPNSRYFNEAREQAKDAAKRNKLDASDWRFLLTGGALLYGAMAALWYLLHLAYVYVTGSHP
jgi:hypothetical protein